MLLSFLRLTHTFHRPVHVVVLGGLTHFCLLLGNLVHLFDALLHGQSIRHGTHGDGLASRATMTTNTFGSGSWASEGKYEGWDGNTPSTRLEHGSLTQSTRSQAPPPLNPFVVRLRYLTTTS